ncbi:radical SAM protein [Streptomyces sp. DSM 44917]|uniref:Radical SAM protein n=1 Tax=Streptomyces boetiae TaxID=3075541 RepID=A0ABU2L6U8_9ACTN|nr:radical SAM protein [Streptomyces sp. DSM 44917]MDT0307296.1 radical SAM protein [Streptomyces sp. DSM 44917]
MPDSTGARALEALRLAGAHGLDRAALAPAWSELSALPDELGAAVAERAPGRVLVRGTLERRLMLLERRDSRWAAADLSGRPHATRRWPGWLKGHLRLDAPEGWLSLASLDAFAADRLSRPRVLLAALYHPEYFPLPRFPLGISDVARAARSTLRGSVELADMQLGVTLEDLIRRVAADRPDILGVSATFGQHDLLTSLLDAAFALPDPPMVVAGGSLTARTEGLLLERYPRLLVARAAGEATMEALLAHWHGDLGRDQVPGLGYNGAARGGGLAIGRRRTAKPASRDAAGDILPELDLLPATFEYHGVAQLETSRGCTNFCSFCPRGHKGLWSGAEPEGLPWLLAELRRIFDRYPGVARTLYLVDEEFIGRGPGAAERALEVARLVHGAGFAWESSCRMDQVVDPARDEAWHAERAVMWRELVGRGLRRMLFGVESGVDSILRRFNKETTGEQNALAIRTLSALGVPTRFTYITFDPLMTLEELKASYAFQGRTDLLLHPQPRMPAQEIVRGVRDEAFVAEHATGRALHTGISYMLVSMECLTGAAYTRTVQQAGLAGAQRPSMGRVDATYADWRIGVASDWAQRWVDRNFALDYTLKSLEKVLDGPPRRAVRQTRVVMKDASFSVLGQMITAIDAHPAAAGRVGGEEALSQRVRAVLETQIDRLRERMAAALPQVAGVLGAEHARTLRREHRRWETATGWRLINAADPCGT